MGGTLPLAATVGILMVVDEIQMGFYRTGKLWSIEHFGVQPDVLVFGKAQMCEPLSVDHYARVHGLTHAEGMVLAASDERGGPFLLAPDGGRQRRTRAERERIAREREKQGFFSKIFGQEFKVEVNDAGKLRLRAQ